jgi:hypothetical protein
VTSVTAFFTSNYYTTKLGAAAVRADEVADEGADADESAGADAFLDP